MHSFYISFYSSYEAVSSTLANHLVHTAELHDYASSFAFSVFQHCTGRHAARGVCVEHHVMMFFPHELPTE